MPGGSENRDPTAEEEVAWTVAAALAARTFKVPLREVMACRDGHSSRARPACALARRAAVYLANVGANLSCRALTRATGLSRPTLRYHLHLVEDDREVKAQLDALMDELARRLGLCMTALASPEVLLGQPPAVAA